MGTTLKKRWETRDQMIGPKPDPQAHAAMVQGRIGLCGEFET